MRKRTEVWIVLGTKLICYRKENRSANRFRNKIVLLWERKQKCATFSKSNCSVMRNRTEEEIVFWTKLFCYRKENRCAKRFRNKIVRLWEREEKCEALWEQNCSLIGKRREVRSVFGTKLFSYGKENGSGYRFGNKIVILSEAEEKCESFSEQNCSVIRKKTEVRIVFETKLLFFWERALQWKPFSQPNCSVMRKRTEEEILFGRKLFCYRKEHRSAKRFRNKIVLLWQREEKCEAFWEQNCSLMGKRREVRSVFVTKLFCYEKENRSVNHFRNKIVLL